MTLLWNVLWVLKVHTRSKLGLLSVMKSVYSILEYGTVGTTESILRVLVLIETEVFTDRLKKPKCLFEFSVASCKALSLWFDE